MGKLDGKVCVITGASRGIGAEIASVFAAEGGKGLVPKRYVDYVSPSSYGSTDRDRDVLEVYRAYITRLSPAGGVEDRLVEHDPATIVDFDDLGFAGP